MEPNKIIEFFEGCETAIHTVRLSNGVKIHGSSEYRKDGSESGNVMVAFAHETCLISVAIHHLIFAVEFSVPSQQHPCRPVAHELRTSHDAQEQVHAKEAL